MQAEATADVPAEKVKRRLKGIFVQRDGDRAFRDRHLVYEDAQVEQDGRLTAYLSEDGFWCLDLKFCGQARLCPACRGVLRDNAIARVQEKAATRLVAG